MAKPESTQMTKLRQVYAEHGVESKEFYEHVRAFFFYLQYKFCGNLSVCDQEDLVSLMWGKLVKSLAYYDPSRTNIGSWVFSVGRYACSSFNYHRRKRSKESEAPLKWMQGQAPRQDLLDGVYARDNLRKVMGTCERVLFSVLDVGDEELSRHMGVWLRDEHPFARFLLWTTSKSQLSPPKRCLR